jgi:hypothetical protein
MNNQPSHSNKSEEIDLGYVFKKISDFFKNTVKLLFVVLAFFKKYIIIVVLLFLIGFGFGYYKDETSKKVYLNEVILIPNVESVDYLYDKVNALNVKIKLKDSLYLKSILDTNYRKIRKIEIEPIVDVYNFVSKSRENIDIFRILLQDQEFKEYLDDFATSKYFKYHRLKFSIVGTNDSQKIVQDILDEFNENEHFSEYLEVGKENTDLQIEQISVMIQQIESIIKSSTEFAAENKSNQSVFINDNSDLANLLIIKKNMLEDLLLLNMKSKDEVQIIKPVSFNYNVVGKGGFSISNKIKYPIILLFFFSFFFFLIYLYKKLKAIAEGD